MAHELAHFYFHDVLSVFPAVVKEGACDQLEERVAPEDRSFETAVVFAGISYLEDFHLLIEGKGTRTQLEYLAKEVPSIEEALALDWRGHLVSKNRALLANFGLGTVVARAIGHRGLIELERQCKSKGLDRVPVDRILSAAGLDPLSQENLTAAFAKACDLNLEPGQTITFTVKN